ncbi:phosphodiester glycosidase family protein [bacterium]|nr:phosphodiester glycosidase family protein [bacterium]
MGKVQLTTMEIPARVDAAGHVLWPAERAHVVSVTTTIDKLAVVDINAKRAYLKEKGFTGAELQGKLNGIFANPLGGSADEVLAMADFASAQVVAGGMYFGEGGSPVARWTDAFLFFKPGAQQGRVIAPTNDHYTSGGYLMFDMAGHASLIRKNDFKYEASSHQVCQQAQCTSIEDYRLIVQSNVILVADGKEDKNPDPREATRSALVANIDGSVSIVATGTPITLAQFGDLLVKMGALHAVNLDGGPSLQMAQRKADGTIEKLIGWSANKSPNKMPSLFIVNQ